MPPHERLAPRARWDLRAALPLLPRLLLGLGIFGFGIAVMVEAGLGLGPWEALHQGISAQTGIPIGTVSILLGLPILALWWPLGERPGIGTFVNVVSIGTATNIGIALLPTPAPGDTPVRVAAMLAGVAIIAVGSALYLATDLGPGPRDGLMTGLAQRSGWSIRRARTVIEILVLLVGFALGGTVGLGTVVFAFGIGPLVQFVLRWADPEGRVGRRRRARLEADGVVGE